MLIKILIRLTRACTEDAAGRRVTPVNITHHKLMAANPDVRFWSYRNNFPIAH